MIWKLAGTSGSLSAFSNSSVSLKSYQKVFFLWYMNCSVSWVGSACCQGVQIPCITISRNDTSDCRIMGLNLSDCINTRNDTIKRQHSQSSWLFQKNSKWQLCYIYSSTAILITKEKYIFDTRWTLSPIFLHSKCMWIFWINLNLKTEVTLPFCSCILTFRVSSFQFLN